MAKIFSYISAHKFWTVVILVVVIGGGYYWYSKAHATTVAVKYATTAVAKDTIVSSVTGSGQVSGENSVNLTPQTSGALTSINVKQGDTVTAGQTIATVDQRSARISVATAQASLASAKANYDNVMSGATALSLQSSQLSVTSAQQSLDQAQANYTNVVEQQKTAVANAYTSMMNAGLQATPSGTNTSTATISVTGTYTAQDKGEYTIMVVASGNGPEFSVSGLEFKPPTNIVTRGVPQALGKNGLFITFSNTGTLVANDTWTINVPNTASSSYLSASNAYDSALQSQTTSVTSAQSQIDNAKLSLQQAQNSYTTTSQPPTDQQIESAQASVTQAEASLQSAEVALQNTVITAPFDGKVAQLDYTQTGVQVGSSNTIATIITAQQIAVISLNEVDVAKIAVGDKATMTFDAVDGLTITGTVAEIDDIGTTSQGVVTYNVKIAFDISNDQVKPGMSANASIITAEKTDVLVVPSAAVKTASSSSGSASYVQVLDSSGQPQNVVVQTGISSDTMTEITSGLTEGQNVVTQTIGGTATSSSATSSTRSSTSLLGGGGGFGGGAVRAVTGGAAGGTGR